MLPAQTPVMGRTLTRSSSQQNNRAPTRLIVHGSEIAGAVRLVLSDLRGVVGGDLVAFCGLDSARRAHWFGQDVPARDLSGGVQGFWAHYGDCPFFSCPDRTGQGPGKVGLAFHDRLQWPVGPPCVVAQGSGDVAGAGRAQDGDG